MSFMFWVWLAVIVGTAITEFCTLEIVSIWFTLAAIIPFILSATVPGVVGWEIQIVIFIVLAAVMLISLRGVTKRYLMKNSNEKTNVDAIVGRKLRMLSRTDFETLGSARVNDVTWSVLGLNQQTIEKDTIVEVVKVAGNRLIVKPCKDQSADLKQTPNFAENALAGQVADSAFGGTSAKAAKEEKIEEAAKTNKVKKTDKVNPSKNNSSKKKSSSENLTIIPDEKNDAEEKHVKKHEKTAKNAKKALKNEKNTKNSQKNEQKSQSAKNSQTENFLNTTKQKDSTNLNKNKNRNRK